MAELPLRLIELQAAVYRADKKWNDRSNYWVDQISNTDGINEMDTVEHKADEDMEIHLEKLQEARAELKEYESGQETQTNT